METPIWWVAISLGFGEWTWGFDEDFNGDMMGDTSIWLWAEMGYTPKKIAMFTWNIINCWISWVPSIQTISCVQEMDRAGAPWALPSDFALRRGVPANLARIGKNTSEIVFWEAFVCGQSFGDPEALLCALSIWFPAPVKKCETERSSLNSTIRYGKSPFFDGCVSLYMGHPNNLPRFPGSKFYHGHWGRWTKPS